MNLFQREYYGCYFFCFFPLNLTVVHFFFPIGTFEECSTEAEVQYWMRYNIFLLLDVGTFSALVELLNMEMEYVIHYVYKESLN